MMSDNKLLSLNEIFNQKFFRIPDFQRGYSWEKSQLEDFSEDLFNLNTDQIHYTGLLTVEMVNKDKVSNIESWQDDLWLLDSGFKPYYLIDGQQRLTTSIILINEILATIGDDDYILFESKNFWLNKFLFKKYNKGNYKSYIFGYEKDNPSDEYFKTKILNQHSSNADKVPENTLYTANLYYAKTFFQEKIRKLSSEEIEVLFKKLVSNFKFNFYEISNELDIYVTFETMNNRGKPLSNLELLKNRLIFLSTLLQETEDEKSRLRKDINNAWKTIYEYLGKNKDKPLNDDKFLEEHWIIYFSYNRKESESYAKFLLNEHFIAKRVLAKELSFNHIQEYVTSLQELVKYWFYLRNPKFSHYENQTKEWLDKLNRIGLRAFSPLLTVALAKESELIFLPLLKSVERFIFLVFLITQRQARTSNTTIYHYAHRLYMKKDNINLSKIIDDINMMTDGMDNDGNYQGWLDIDRFISYINDLNNKYKGFYDWSGLRYFLYEYELHLQHKSKQGQKVEWSNIIKLTKDETIEHIYPQTSNHHYWKKRFEQYDKYQQKILLHHFGNLVLLSRSKNAELQNYDFDYKKKHHNKEGDLAGFHNGSYSEIEVSTYDEWNAQSIKIRAIKMLEFMDENWNLRLKEYWGKEFEEIIKLDFVEDDK